MAYAKEDTSLAELKDYRVVPRVKVVQALSRPLIDAGFAEGDIVLMPAKLEIGPVFDIVPLFFFPEFITWKDRKDKNPETPMIIGRSFDRGSVIAAKAAKPETRTEEYGQGMKMRHCEHLNFICIVYGEHDLKGTAITLSFSRGEYRSGREFINKIMMRKQDGVEIPLWGQVWRCEAAQHSTDQHSWAGLDIVNADVPFIQDNEVGGFKQLHEEFKKLHSAALIQVDRDLDDEEPVAEM